MKKSTIRQMYWFSIVGEVFCLIVGIAGIILVTTNANGVMDYHKILGLMFIIGVNIGFVVFIAFTLKTFILLLKDYSAVKNNKYCSIVGKVIGFKRNRDPETGIQINNRPIVMIGGTNEKISGN